MHRQASFWIAPSRIAISWKDDKTSSSIFLKLLSISLVKFSYWSKFLVNIITGSGVMAILIYKELKSQIIGNIPIWVLPNNWRLKQVRNTKFGTNVSKKMLLNAAKCQVTPFTISELLRKNQQWRVKLPSPLSQIRVNYCDLRLNM